MPNPGDMIMDDQPILKRSAKWRSEQLTDKYIILMLLVFPVFWGFNGYSAITASKHVFFVTASCVWLLAITACGAVNMAKNGFHFKPVSLTQWSVIAFMAVSLISAAASPYGRSAILGAGRFDGLLTTLLYCAVFLGISVTAKPRIIYVYCLGFSVLACCVTAILQLLGFNPLLLYPDGLTYFDAHIKYSSEFLGTIGNAGLLAGLLCLAVPLLSAAYIIRGKKMDRLLIIPVCAAVFVLIESKIAGSAPALAFCVLISAPLLLRDTERISRAFLLLAAVAAVALASAVFRVEFEAGMTDAVFEFNTLQTALLTAAVFFLCISIWFRRTKLAPSPRSLSLIFVVLSCTALLSMLIIIYFWPGNTGSMYELSSVLHGQMSGQFGSSRVLIWQRVLELFPERPLLGGGPGTLALRLDVTFSRYVPETGKTMTTFVDNAHNEYIGYLANIGILGLIAYMAAISFSLYKMISSRKSDSLKTAFGCGVICYWIYGLFGLGLSLVAPIFWILWGILETRHNEQDFWRIK